MFQMKCQVTSSITRRVMISREVEVVRYKDVCEGEKRRVNIGYRNQVFGLTVDNNKLQEYPSHSEHNLKGVAHDWEVFTKFFSFYNIEPNWLNCYTLSRVIMTRIWEVGLAAWGRFDDPENNYY